MGELTPENEQCNLQKISIDISGGSRHSDKGGGGHPDAEIREMPGLKKTFFRPFGPQFSLKIRGGGAPWVPPLDPPLDINTKDVLNTNGLVEGSL